MEITRWFLPQAKNTTFFYRIKGHLWNNFASYVSSAPNLDLQWLLNGSRVSHWIHLWHRQEDPISMLETIIGLLFLGSIVFVATTGESSSDKKEDEKDANEVNNEETTSYNHKPVMEQKTSESTSLPPPEPWAVDPSWYFHPKHDSWVIMVQDNGRRRMAKKEEKYRPNLG